MKQPKFRANASEINKNPKDVRYVFTVRTAVAVFLGETVYQVNSCASYQTLSKVKPENTRDIWVTDLFTDSVIKLDPDKLQQFLEEWRNNYFNRAWIIPDELKVQ